MVGVEEQGRTVDGSFGSSTRRTRAVARQTSAAEPSHRLRPEPPTHRHRQYLSEKLWAMVEAGPNFWSEARLLRSEPPSAIHYALPLPSTPNTERKMPSSLGMNIAEPVSSSISGVEFGFLTSEEIRALSVKRITNSVTFDNLLHPTPGGLYDAALGAFLDNPSVISPFQALFSFHFTAIACLETMC